MTELQTLIGLQDYDTRIATLESEAARLPREIEALHAALSEARNVVEALRARLDASRKELRARERDLDDIGVKRAKSEAKLYEVKTNTEYSAVLVEIESIKTQKAKTEEEILALMERQEGLAVEIREAEARYASRESQARRDEATIRQRLAAVDQQLEGVRAERASLAREVPRNTLADYERILKARGGLGVAAVTSTSVWCSGCRVSIRPQAVQELRSGQVLLHCESCGRFLYWRE
ncbi:MAG TPA: C4-type zinc ribbon domain-containing protein [Methylomirabilota bacterium]|nr:C4-type zinc ribbon domain-containing protein [Methylomirabilota bacterium]